MTRADLWTCPDCSRPFANRNQAHSCGQWTVEGFLAGHDDRERALFHRFARAVLAAGNVTAAPAKTRVGFQARMIFASANRLSHGALHVHLVLGQRVVDERFARIDEISDRCFVHHLVLRSPDDVDAQLERWIAQAYEVGEQRASAS